MDLHSWIQKIGIAAAIVLPLFNVPLMLKVHRRKSSSDFSMSWALGVWICMILMAPSGFTSEDIVWKTFNIANLGLFTGVVFVTLKYRKGKK